MKTGRRDFLRKGSLAAGALCFGQGRLAKAAAEERPPNFIVIFTDDQGYQDMGCFGAPRIKTPILDKMAAQGVRFTDFYSASAICSPSRAALLSGCYPPRVGITDVLWPHDTKGLNPAEMTIARVLKQRGYATACVGKWHLGHHPAFLPQSHGFDSYFGVPYSNDMKIDPKMALAPGAVLREGMTEERLRNEEPKKNWVPLLRNEQVVEYPADQRTLTKRYTEEAVAFIEANKEKPFFLYLPHTMPHIPLAASADFAGKSEGGRYGDTIEEIDWSTGRILETLETLGLDDNTLVIFTSDNGPWNLSDGRGGCAAPLRGFKFSTYEGGMRVPCVMRWPGKLPAGAVCAEIAGTIDLFPTLAKLAGAPLPKDRVIDGKDIWPLMANPGSAKTPHDAYYYYRGPRLEAVRRGHWKLRLPAKNPPELYDLKTDIGESKNRAKEEAAVLESLKERVRIFDAALKAARRPPGRLR